MAKGIHLQPGPKLKDGIGQPKANGSDSTGRQWLALAPNQIPQAELGSWEHCARLRIESSLAGGGAGSGGMWAPPMSGATGEELSQAVRQNYD